MRYVCVFMPPAVCLLSSKRKADIGSVKCAATLVRAAYTKVRQTLTNLH